MKTIAALVAFLTVSTIAVSLRAADAVDAQYQALATSRTNAELSIRRTRAFYGSLEGVLRQVNADLERAHQRAAEKLQRQTQEEQRKPDEDRNQLAMEDFEKQRIQLDEDWRNFDATDRMTVQQTLGEGAQANAALGQAFQNLAGVEGNFKDAKLDLSALKAVYDSITAASDAARSTGEEAIAKLRKDKATWESWPTSRPAKAGG